MQHTRATPILAVAIACWLALAACGTEDAGGRTTQAPVDEETTVTTLPEREDRTPGSPPEAVPPDAIAPPTVAGEVPADLLEPVVADAAERAGIAPEGVVVVTAQEMVWNDGSLGCAEPGEFYTQAEVPGYWVVVEAAGAAYDYRLDDGGFFKLCTSPLPAPGDSSPTS